MNSTTLIEENTALAMSLSNKWCWDPYYLEDCQQTAMLALTETALLYAQEETNDLAFTTMAFYRISSALRKYRNTMSNIVTIPLKESNSKNSYSKLIAELISSTEVFNTGVEAEEIAYVWKHPIEKELSEPLRMRIRKLKESISSSKNYKNVVLRTVNYGKPVSFKDSMMESTIDSSEFMLDYSNYRDSLRIFEKSVLDLKVAGHSTEDTSTMINQNPRRVRDAWTQIKKDISEFKTEI